MLISLCPTESIPASEVRRLWLEDAEDAASGFREVYESSWLSRLWYSEEVEKVDAIFSRIQGTRVWRRYNELGASRLAIAFRVLGLGQWVLTSIQRRRQVFGAPRILIYGRTKTVEIIPINVFIEEMKEA